MGDEMLKEQMIGLEENHTNEDSEKQEEGSEMIILKSGDGKEFKVKKAAVKASLTIQNIIDDGCLNGCVPLPNVMSTVLAHVIEYLNHYIGDSEEVMSELNEWNTKFLEKDTDELFEIMIAAHYLEVKPLQDITGQTMANMIKDMTVEEMGQTKASHLLESSTQPQGFRFSQLARCYGYLTQLPRGFNFPICTICKSCHQNFGRGRGSIPVWLPGNVFYHKDCLLRYLASLLGLCIFELQKPRASPAPLLDLEEGAARNLGIEQACI